MILLILMVATWSTLQLVPSAFAHGDPLLLYGVPSGGRSNEMIGHAAFRLNGNADRFHAWTSGDDRDVMEELLRSGAPLRVQALRSGPFNFTVVAIDNGDVGLGPEQLTSRSHLMGVVGIGVSTFTGLLLLWLLFEYAVFYRHMRWFTNEPRLGNRSAA